MSANKKPLAKSLDKKTLVRSISIPVASCLSGEWKEFMALARQSWRQSTDLSNWASQTLARSDVVRMPGMKELPPLKAVDLYALAFGRDKVGKPRTAGKGPLPIVQAQYDGGEFWAGAKIAAASLLRQVDRKYRLERGKVIWRRERRTPEFVYPVPFPVHQQSWTVFFDDSKNRGTPVLSLGLPGGRVSVRLRNGPEFQHAIKVLKQIEAGEVKQMELKLCLQTAYASHRAQGEQRQAGGGHRQSFRVMVRISYSFEVYANPAAKVIEAKTGSDPFVILTDPGVRDWVLHCPWVKMWVKEHRKLLDDFADDLKFEKRWPAQKRHNLNSYRKRRCEKHARRMKTWRQQTAAQVVGWASRQRAGRILWDDTDKSFAAEVPWFLLRTDLQNNCDEAGIVLVASGEVAESEEEEIL